MELEVRRFDRPDEHRELELGGLDLVALGGMTLGRASYEPGWKWSEHVGKGLGQTLCQVEHVGMVVSGHNRITMADGRMIDVGPGDIFAVPPGHDSEVLGDEPYVSLHLTGGERYAR
jgi:hypothetical protein